jgi:hypothetical protein
MSQENVQLFDLHVDHEGTQFLAQAAKWGRFLSIVGFVFVGLLAIFSLFAGTILTKMSDLGNVDGTASSGLGPAVGGMITFVYLLVAALWFMPVLYLYRFSTKMQSALRSNDQHFLNDSFKNLKSCFRFMGIVTIIVLGFYALALVIGLGALVAGGR